MQGAFARSNLALVAVLVVSSVAAAQTPDARTPQGRRGGISNLAEQISKDAKPAGPAPKHDLNGVWAGPTDSVARNVPPMTPLGEARFKLNKPEPVFRLAGTNDPLATCDPLGFPRNVLNETRGMQFAQLPD